MPAGQLYQLLIVNPTRNIISSRDLPLRQERHDPFARSKQQLLPERKLLELSLRDNVQQFELDAAMWFGAIKTGPWKMLLTKIFHIFYQGGIIYRAQNEWKDWSENQYGNVASLLSHGQRVLVQIPSVENGGDKLWEWLNQPDQIPTRPAATHGQSKLDNPTPLIKGHSQYVVEKGSGKGTFGWVKGFGQAISGKILGRHFGFNVALGGKGNRNPFSATNDDQAYSYRPIQADGRNGHVYINYMPPTQGKVGGMLIGCENAEYGKGKNPHTDAGHGLGGAQKVSACGGKKWSEMAVGPWAEYNGMICDLVNTRYENLDWLTGIRLFDPDRLDGPTNAVADVGARVIAAGRGAVVA